MVTTAAAKARHLTQPIIDLNGATRIAHTQTVKCSANGVEFALNQDRVAAVQVSALNEALAQRIRDGQAPKVKVYDKAAPSQRPVVMPTPEMQRTRDRAAPAPVR